MQYKAPSMCRYLSLEGASDPYPDVIIPSLDRSVKFETP